MLSKFAKRKSWQSLLRVNFVLQLPALLAILGLFVNRALIAFRLRSLA